MYRLAADPARFLKSLTVRKFWGLSLILVIIFEMCILVLLGEVNQLQKLDEWLGTFAFVFFTLTPLMYIALFLIAVFWCMLIIPIKPEVSLKRIYYVIMTSHMIYLIVNALLYLTAFWMGDSLHKGITAVISLMNLILFVRILYKGFKEYLGVSAKFTQFAAGIVTVASLTLTFFNMLG